MSLSNDKRPLVFTCKGGSVLDIGKWHRLMAEGDG